MNRSLLRPAALALALLAGASPAAADNFLVNIFDIDAGDANLGSSACDHDAVTAGDQCTLRAAVMQANATPGTDLIVIPVGSSITLTLAGAGEAQGDLDITEAVSITGAFLGFPSDPGDVVEIIGAHGDRLFDIAATGVDLTGLRLAGGDAGAFPGGAIRVQASGGASIDLVRFSGNRAQTGGAIQNLGVLEVTRSDFVLNRAVDSGAAIRNAGILDLSRSSIRQIRDEPSADEPDAIRTDPGSILRVENVTIDGYPTGFDPTDTGGIRAIEPALLHLRNSTLVGFTHRALNIDAGPGDEVVIANNIVAFSEIEDCDVNFVDGADGSDVLVEWNHIPGNGCDGLGEHSLQTNIDPVLGPLTNDAGSLHWYRAPSFASTGVDLGAPDDAAAIDPALVCLPIDQRGVSRPLDGNGDAGFNPRCDPGAIEISTLASDLYTVNVFDEDLPDDNTGDGVCDANMVEVGLQCTLRAAVMQANAKPGPDRIAFAPSDEAVQLTIPSAAEPNPAAGDLDVFEELTITGNEGDGRPLTTIQQTAGARLFRAQTPNGQVVSFRSLRLTGGETTEPGGAILAVGNGGRVHVTDSEVFGNSAGAGGAIAATVRVVVSNSDIRDNGAAERGGAILSEHELVVTGSSLRRNTADDLDPSARAAIVATEGSELVVAASTLDDNSGGVWTRAANTAIGGVAITGNTQWGLRVVDHANGTIRMRGSVLANNGAGDCILLNGPIDETDLYNFIADGSCGGATNLQGNPQLAPALARFDGVVSWARVPLAGSPLIDAWPDLPEPGFCPGNEQRGDTSRPIDGDGDGSADCDIGPIELVGAELEPVAPVVNVYDEDRLDMVPGDTLCDVSAAPGTQCTLRAAIMETNAIPGANTVTFAASAPTVVLDRAPQAGPASATHGDLDVTDALTLLGTVKAGPEQRPHLVASHGDRHFSVSAAGDDVSFVGLRLSGGSTSGSGGAIRVLNANEVELNQVRLEANASEAGGGGFALLAGEAVIEDSDLTGNATAGLGGAIRNEGVLTLRRSSVRGNLDGSAEREAIASGSGSLTLILDSTVADNQGHGVAIDGGTLSAEHATIADNGDFGIAFGTAAGETLYLANTVLHGNGDGGCSTSGGQAITLSIDHYNQSQDGGCGLSGGATNLPIGVDPLLGTLRVEPGSFSAYYLPAAGSPLLDAGHPAVSAVGCSAVDQLGTLRPIDGDGDGTERCDIGAVERDPSLQANVLFEDSFED